MRPHAYTPPRTTGHSVTKSHLSGRRSTLVNGERKKEELLKKAAQKPNT